MVDEGNPAGTLSGEVSHYLEGIDFPAQKEDILKLVQANQPNETMVAALEQIPDGEYVSSHAVAQQLGARRK